MKVEEHVFLLDSYELNRFVIRPDGAIRGAFIFFHGQGDYADRYVEVLRPIVNMGLLCVLADLPGHGRSSGRRGVIPSYEMVDEIYENNVSLARELVGSQLPIGLGGHSMGGHLAFRTLLANPGRHPFSWISSPLLTFQTARWKVFLLGHLAIVFPWLVVSTGVRDIDCRAGAEEGRNESALHHSLIGLGWARHLITGLPTVSTELLVRDLGTNLLLTQGDADVVCPAPLLLELVERMKTEPEVVLAADGLHEPFVGPRGDLLMAEVKRFILKFL